MKIYFVLLALLLNWNANAQMVPGCSTTVGGGYGCGYGGPSVYQQNTNIIRDMEARARAGSHPVVQQVETHEEDRERIWKEQQRIKKENQIAEDKARQLAEKTKLDKIAIERRELIDDVGKNTLLVNNTVFQAREKLYSSEIESKMEPEAFKYTERQLDMSDRMAHTAWSNAAMTFDSAEGVKTSSDLARDIINSTNIFLDSVADGFYDGFVTTAQAMQAIYNDPNLVRNLSGNMLLFLEGNKGRYLLSKEVAIGVEQTVNHFRRSIYQYANTMTYGSLDERGYAIGTLGHQISMLAVGPQITSVIVEAGIIGKVGKSVYEGMSTSTALRSEIIASEMRVGYDTVPQIARTNLESVRQAVYLLRNNNIPLEGRRKVIEAFTQNSRVVTLQEDKVVYRYWVEGSSRPRGHWLTPELIENPHVDLALPNGGPYQVQRWVIPKGTQVIDGLASPNFDMPGGGPQIYVPNSGVLQ